MKVYVYGAELSDGIGADNWVDGLVQGDTLAAAAEVILRKHTDWYDSPLLVPGDPRPIITPADRAYSDGSWLVVCRVPDSSLYAEIRLQEQSAG